MTNIMLLIPGRSSKQGTSLNKGKLKEEYQTVTTTVEINEEDMVRLGVQQGDKLRLSNNIGETIVTCAGCKADDLPTGVIFMAYGPATSRLMGGDTAGTGMPLSKNLEVKVEKFIT